MKLLSSLAGGLAGAVTVSIIHAVLRNTKFSKPHKIGLNGNGEHSNGAHKHDNKSSKWMTIGLYLAGALVTAAVARWLERDKQSIVSPLNPPVESYKPVIDITV